MQIRLPERRSTLPSRINSPSNLKVKSALYVLEHELKTTPKLCYHQGRHLQHLPKYFHAIQILSFCSLTYVFMISSFIQKSFLLKVSQFSVMSNPQTTWTEGWTQLDQTVATARFPTWISRQKPDWVSFPFPGDLPLLRDCRVTLLSELIMNI